MKTKGTLRDEIWALLQQRKVARFPGAEGRIPNFTGAERCAGLLAGASWWKNAKVLKVNPDSPQRAVPPIDLIVCGSVAVNRKGARVGKGGGYSDLEFALLTEEKKIRRGTPIITTVHPLQIIDEAIPMTEHDIPLTAIVTPEEIIEIEPSCRRPRGIYWDMLPEEKIADIPTLRTRRRR